MIASVTLYTNSYTSSKGEGGLPIHTEDGVQWEVRREVRGRGQEGVHDHAGRGV